MTKNKNKCLYHYYKWIFLGAINLNFFVKSWVKLLEYTKEMLEFQSIKKIKRLKTTVQVLVWQCTPLVPALGEPLSCRTAWYRA